MSEVLSSGLTITIPSEGDQNWATSIKNNCFQKISEHDHTGAGNGVQIATGAIANLAITSAKLADGAVTETKLGNNSVTRDKIFNLEVTTGKLADLAVTAAKIASATITATQIASNAITTAKILDGNITEAKLDADAASRSASFDGWSHSTIGEGTVAATALDRVGLPGIGLFSIPKAAKITHMSISTGILLGAGSIKVHVYNNATPVAFFIFDSATLIYSGALNTPVAFAAGEALSVYIELIGANWFGATTSGFVANPIGHYTE